MTTYQLIELIEKMNVYAAAFLIASFVMLIQGLIVFIEVILKALLGLLVGLVAARIVKHDEIAIGNLQKWYDMAVKDTWDERHSCSNCGCEDCSFPQGKERPTAIIDCIEWEPER